MYSIATLSFSVVFSPLREVYTIRIPSISGLLHIIPIIVSITQLFYSRAIRRYNNKYHFNSDAIVVIFFIYLLIRNHCYYVINTKL